MRNENSKEMLRKAPVPYIMAEREEKDAKKLVTNVRSS